GHDELVHARLGPVGPLAVHAHHVPAVFGEHVGSRAADTPGHPGNHHATLHLDLRCNSSMRLRLVFWCTRSHACGLLFELCGASMTLSICLKGLSAGRGSSSNTSRAAPAIRPSCKALTSAASSTTGPRAVLMSTACGCISASSASPTRW